MEFRVLGPLEVLDGGVGLSLGGAKQRALLAYLLLHANRIVSTENLIDALWGERAPETATHTLHVYVSQLRKVFREAGSPGSVELATEARGYVLRIDPEDLDLDRFERLTAGARKELEQGEFGDAADQLRKALDLWRGPPLSDLPYEGFPRQEIARLEELHLAAVEDRIEADLHLGRHAQLVSELQTLVREHPLRERLAGQLMLALYRSGRQAESLQVYRDTQITLNTELGIDPSSSLQQLEQRILQQDPELDWQPSEAEPPRAEAGPTRRLAPLAIVVGVVVVALAGIVAVAFSRQIPAPPSSVGLNSVGRIDERTAELVASIPTAGRGAGALTWADGSIWVANTISRTVARIDPETDEVMQSVPTDGAPTDIAAGEGMVWVLNGLEGEVHAIDPRTNEVTLKISVPQGSGGIAVGAGFVWVTNPLETTLTKINPGTGEVLRPIPLGPRGSGSPEAIAVGGDAVWVGDGLAPAMWKVNAATDEVVGNPGLRGVPSAIAVAPDGRVWLTSYEENLVTVMDPTTLQSTTYDVGRGPSGIATGENAVWVVHSLDGTASSIDPSSGEDLATVEVGDTPLGIALGGGWVWVSRPA
jgi:DNA-binding SARP family transcriptional activator/DNA-binding beta-propeller fold protein YncE